ncbi:hypothetical protein FRC08_006941 [Ceratobasidium sp. 394]|nr:hypothetical protein FRC08_006941 [Ceratobasidium sp. 394]
MHDGSVVNRSVVDGRSFDGRSHDGRSHDGRSHGGHSHVERSLHDASVREPSITQHSMHDGSVIHRSVHDGRSSRGGSEHRVSGRSVGELSNHSGGRSLHNRSAHDLHMHVPSDGYRSPSLPEASVRDPSVREALSDGDRENDHTHDYERSIRSGPSPSLHAPSHRALSPSLHVPSHRGSPSLHAPSSHRAMSPSLHDPHSRVASPLSHREASPSIHALSHREGSSVHAHSHREASPSIHAPSHRDHSPSIHRGASPSLQAPSYRSTSPIPGRNGMAYSPPASVHAPSERSRAPSSIASSKVPKSSIGRFTRPKSPLSVSESSNTSRRTRTPLGPEITPVVVPGPGSTHAPSTHAPSMHAPSTHAPSIASHRTGASRSVARSPLASQYPMGEAPPPPPKTASVAGSHRSGRTSEARTTRSNGRRL